MSRLSSARRWSRCSRPQSSCGPRRSIGAKRRKRSALPAAVRAGDAGDAVRLGRVPVSLRKPAGAGAARHRRAAAAVSARISRLLSSISRVGRGSALPAEAATAVGGRRRRRLRGAGTPLSCDSRRCSSSSPRRCWPRVWPSSSRTVSMRRAIVVTAAVAAAHRRQNPAADAFHDVARRRRRRRAGGLLLDARHRVRPRRRPRRPALQQQQPRRLPRVVAVPAAARFFRTAACRRTRASTWRAILRAERSQADWDRLVAPVDWAMLSIARPGAALRRRPVPAARTGRRCSGTKRSRSSSDEPARTPGSRPRATTRSSRPARTRSRSRQISRPIAAIGCCSRPSATSSTTPTRSRRRRCCVCVRAVSSRCRALRPGHSDALPTVLTGGSGSRSGTKAYGRGPRWTTRPEAGTDLKEMRHSRHPGTRRPWPLFT